MPELQQQTRKSIPPARLLLLPLAAFFAVLPLIAQGCSCGHDFGFHLQSWLDASQQFRTGTLHPHWIFSAAWNSGEPRFVFYPPLSWTLGGLLALIVPFSAMPALFTWIALTAAAFTCYRLAREFVAPNAALLAATIYIVNPYMLFTAYERTAFAELLAAAWIPLLLLAALRPRISIPRVAIATALLWLTNAPAAVMGCYAFAIVIVMRLVRDAYETYRNPRTEPVTDEEFYARLNHPNRTLLSNALGGVALGLALPAFYLVPAAYERRYVQIAMAVIPNMRIEDNFLFGHTADAPHNVVLHTASLIAVTLSLITIPFLILNRKQGVNVALTALASTILLMLTPLSKTLWRVLPELSFLQFPWRMLAILGVVLALSIALLLQRFRLNNTLTALTVVAIAVVFSQVEVRLYRQGCALLDRPAARAELFNTHHGVDPTDEYTAITADNDFLRTDDPAFWLADSPTAYAPNTVPNPAATLTNYDTPPPIEQTISQQTPLNFTIAPTTPQYLILNLRDYPNWHITRTGRGQFVTEINQRLSRDDGLIAVPVPAGQADIDISWHRTVDASFGEVLSFGALSLLCAAFLHSRSLRNANTDPSHHVN